MASRKAPVLVTCCQPYQNFGDVAEWSIAPSWKGGGSSGPMSSNLIVSANFGRFMVSAMDATTLARGDDAGGRQRALLIDGSAVRFSANHGHAQFDFRRFNSVGRVTAL
jgi:hypothetical protein